MLGGEVAYPRSHRNSTKGFTFAGASGAFSIIIREELQDLNVITPVVSLNFCKLRPSDTTLLL